MNSTQSGDWAALGRELDWLETVLDARMAQHFSDDPDAGGASRDRPPDHGNSALGALITQHGLAPDERLILALALAPHLRPEALDAYLIRNQITARRFTEFGGTAQDEAGFRPTVQSAVFLLDQSAAGRSDLGQRMAVVRLLAKEERLRRAGLIELEAPLAGHVFSCPLEPGGVLLRRLLASHAAPWPTAGGIAATRIETALGWNDLILPATTQLALEQIVTWARFAPELAVAGGPARLFGPGYRALLHGPPGTGKTLAATLLGQRLHQPVYRVDLSQIISKWIGETEKNLARVFDESARHGWILFFDEADALFGKRTDPSSANDRHANQEVAFILQRIEAHNGLVLLASNLRGHIDAAFTRRFQTVVHFPEPGPPERLLIWQSAFAGSDWLAPDSDLQRLADEYPLTGATIVNCLRTAVLAAMADGRRQLTDAGLTHAIMAEMRKQSRLKERAT